MAIIADRRDWCRRPLVLVVAGHGRDWSRYVSGSSRDRLDIGFLIKSPFQRLLEIQRCVSSHPEAVHGVFRTDQECRGLCCRYVMPLRTMFDIHQPQAHNFVIPQATSRSAIPTHSCRSSFRELRKPRLPLPDFCTYMR